MDVDEIELHIVSRPDTMLGKPVVRGTRIPVYVIIDLVAAGLTVEEIVDDYPDLTQQDVRAALAFAALYEDRADQVARSA